MNLEFYRIIGGILAEGIEKSYKAGLASIVKLNKKEILRLKDDDEPELFKINYNGTDYKMLQNFRVEAFTVAGVQSYELEEKLKQLALDIQEGKHPLAKGEKDIKELWSAEAQNLISDYVPAEDMPPPNQLKTNLRTAMQSSYHAAQYNRLQDSSVKDLYPAYQYKTLADVRVREEHRKLHDRIWSSDDEIWHRIWPPNGWNCRCYIKPLNQDEKQNSAVEPLTTTDEFRQEIVREGKIGKDFDRNPGVVGSIWGKWKDAKLKGMNKNEISNRINEYLTNINSKETLDSIIFPPALSKIGDHLKKYEGDIIKAFEENAIVVDDVEFNAENWGRLFSDNRILTHIGYYKMGDNQFEKFLNGDEGKRKNFLGMFYQTLKDPLFITYFKDEGKTFFLNSFIGNDKVKYFIAVGIQKEGAKIIISGHREKIKEMLKRVKGGELLYTKLTALDSAAPESPKQFSFGSGRFNYSKLNFSHDIKNIKITADTMNENELRNIMLKANEIWGETYNYKGVVNSELNFIRYRVDGFQLVKINNNEAYDFIYIGYDRIHEYRKGVIIYA